MSSETSGQAELSRSELSTFATKYFFPTLRVVFSGGTLLTFVWGVYTYSVDQAQRNQQNVIAAFDLIDRHIGEGNGGLGKMVDDAITPLTVPDPHSPWWATEKQTEWWDARKLADSADPIARKAGTMRMQKWLIENVLIKTGGQATDKITYNYQTTKNVMDYLYRFAKINPCNAEVVVFKFQKSAYNFFYYYPGEYDFSKSEVRAVEPDVANPRGPENLGDEKWGRIQSDECDRRQR